MSAKKCARFYAEIVKFGLVSTHLKLFWGQTGGGDKKIIRGNLPPPPPRVDAF